MTADPAPHHRARRTILVTGAAGSGGSRPRAQLARPPGRGASCASWGSTSHRPTCRGSTRSSPVAGAHDPALRRRRCSTCSPGTGPTWSCPRSPRSCPASRSLGAGGRPGRAGWCSPRPGPAAVAADKLLTMWALTAPGRRGARARDRRRDRRRPPTRSPGPVDRSWSSRGCARGGRGVHVVERPDDPIWTELVDGAWLVQVLRAGHRVQPAGLPLADDRPVPRGGAGEDRAQAGTGRQRDRRWSGSPTTTRRTSPTSRHGP